MIPKKPVAGVDPVMETGFWEKIVLKMENLDHDPIQLNWIKV